MTRRLSATQRLAVLAVPWLFLCAFTAVWLLVLIPRAVEGHAALICICAFATLALGTFLVAAITFSRDVLRGRWPTEDAN